MAAYPAVLHPWARGAFTHVLLEVHESAGPGLGWQSGHPLFEGVVGLSPRRAQVVVATGGDVRSLRQ